MWVTADYTTNRESPDLVVVSVVGEIDAYTAPTIHDGIRTAITDHLHPRRVRVDLAGVSFLDSSGIQALIRCRAEAVARGVAMAVANPQPQPRKVLHIAGLTDLLAVTMDDDAID